MPKWNVAHDYSTARDDQHQATAIGPVAFICVPKMFRPHPRYILT